MICLYAESHLCTFTLIIYNFIVIPFLQITQSILRFFTYLFNPHQLPENHDHFQETQCEINLPVSRFQDLDSSNKGSIDDEEEMCSICLMEFQNEDLVNKLPKCGHLFHMECMEKWLDRCQFTCPLCRSLVLDVHSSPCKNWASDFCVLPHAIDS
ncbi:hypothetical protein ACJIZ3_006643 [Penstemon smallii]|uniref:RING-type domain-containing protein n=1 Tax=Penstemon smallii TaxID=265156 RepID=A0ABD3S8T5_9LAMI